MFKRILFSFLMLLSAVSLMAKVDSCKGPYMMTQNVSVPSGCSKVIVDSSSSMINGAITLKNESTGEVISMFGSATYVQTWYYVVTSGKYEVVQLGSNYGTRFNNGQKLYVGAKITINGTGYLSFEP